MMEESDERKVIEFSPLEVGVSIDDTVVISSYSTRDIRERLEDNEYVVALILTSAWLENIVGRAIRHHYGWNSEKFQKEGYHKMSLGSLLEECAEYGALKAHEEKLNKFRSGEKQIVSLRNNLVHEHGYLNDIEEGEDAQQEVEDAIEEVVEFIETVEVVR